jgi:hypothetical protein
MADDCHRFCSAWAAVRLAPRGARGLTRVTVAGPPGFLFNLTAPTMDHDEALLLFESLTGASNHIAEHVLEAHGWDVNSAVEWYLESGGVGFGAPQQAPASPPDLIEEPDDLGDEEPGQGPRGSRPSSRPLPAAARPRSSPIEVPRSVAGGRWRVAGRERVPPTCAAHRRSDCPGLGLWLTFTAPVQILDDDDDDIQVLASSLGRRRANRVEEVAEGADSRLSDTGFATLWHSWALQRPPACPPTDTAPWRLCKLREALLQIPACPWPACPPAAEGQGMQRVGSVEEELGAGSQGGRRVRRNRRRMAGEVDRDLELLGES